MVGGLIALWLLVAIVLVAVGLVVVAGIIGGFALSLLVLAVLARA